MNLLGTLAKVAVGVMLARGAGRMMRGGGSTGGGSTDGDSAGGGLGDLMGGLTRGGGAGDLLGGLLGGLAGGRGQSGGGLGDLLGGVLSGGGAAGGAGELGGLGGLLESLGGARSGGGGLGQMFNRGGRGGRGRGASAGAGPQRGADVEATLTLDFVDAAKGLTTTLSLTSDAPCSTCHGSGARPGTQPTVCSQCGGRGVIDDNQGFFSFSSPCRACAGRGVTIEQPCGTCRGTGVEHRPRDVQARIPAGVADGQKIRLKGRGAPGRNGGPAGDLIVECHVAPHPLFGRDGHNLTVRVPVTFAEAALGGDIDVPTLDGPRVMLRLRPGTQSGSRHRVKGKGIVTAKHTGDLIVTVDVDVPHHLTPEQKAAVDAFAEATTVSPRAHLKGA